MKKRIVTIFAVLFLMLGSAFLVVPQISNIVYMQIARSTIDEFERLKENTVDGKKPTEGENSVEAEDSIERVETKSHFDTILYKVDIDRLYKDSVNYNENLKQNQRELLVNEFSYLQPSLDLKDYGIPNGVYGYVSAPSIGMELPIYLGASNYNMAYGAAHMTYTSLPVGGENTNCVLAAHTGYIGRIFFDYIRNLNIGDTVQVTNYWDELTYKVVDKQIYKKYQSSDCYISEGKDLLTMITCANGGTDRYYVICERRNSND